MLEWRCIMPTSSRYVVSEKGKACFRKKTSLSSYPLVESCGIESPPGTRRRSAAVAAIGLYDKRSAVAPSYPQQRKKTGTKPVFFVGGDKRDRTADLLNAIQALSQLSYTPIFCSGLP